jgi:hypothetical protein
MAGLLTATIRYSVDQNIYVKKMRALRPRKGHETDILDPVLPMVSSSFVAFLRLLGATAFALSIFPTSFGKRRIACRLLTFSAVSLLPPLFVVLSWEIPWR